MGELPLQNPDHIPVKSYTKPEMRILLVDNEDLFNVYYVMDSDAEALLHAFI